MTVREFAILAGIFAAVSSAPGNFTEVRTGDREEDVYDALGAPQGEFKRSGVKILLYDEGAVEIRRGKVARIDQADIRDSGAPRQTSEGAADGILSSLNAWVNWFRNQFTGSAPDKPVEVAAAAPAAQTSRSHGPAVRVISDGGRALTLSKVLVPGGVTVVDFYADWCGPCRRISPLLEKMASQDEDVYLRKIDIVDWGTEVAVQHGIRSIPHICVYNREGQIVGNPTSSYNEVVRLVSLAK